MAEMAETAEMAEIEEKTSCSPYLLLSSVGFHVRAYLVRVSSTGGCRGGS